MSHFPVLVLTTQDDEEEVANLLRPYDEAGEWFADGSRWDWWQIGGRFTGLLSGYAHDGDRIAVADLELNDDCLPTAVVTPDGKWHERGRVGWFGMSMNDERGRGDKPEAIWSAVVQALVEQHPDAYAVIVDCHV